ncbi:MAG: enoyl-CoA hydratase/isomerase family protein [Deltaproteobacteria bacterium]|nr:enoyl-CoA hydratase/isomerase family protein [Deltaproteobacteria bacterium]
MPNTPSFETLLYDVDEAGVATITLNRPERHNAFNATMAIELEAVWRAVKADPNVLCAIVTGAGDRAFCSGMDVADVASGEALESGKMPRESVPWNKLTPIQNECWKPVVSAINGMVVAGGLHFVIDCDLVLCSETATFFDTHVKVGLIAGVEPVGLTRKIPLEAVLRLALLGGSERMSAAEAHRLGMVGEVLPPDRLMPRARELAHLISQHSPTALAITKRCIWQSLDTGLDEALENTWDIIRAHNDHPDLKEGARAFVEKRNPSWAPYTGS